MGKDLGFKRVLFAHQSTIPHYRIPFFNTLECLRPEYWQFEVVFDPTEVKGKRYFQDDLNTNEFQFPTLNVKTYLLHSGERTISYQTFWSRARNYDLVIVEDAINNLTYPLILLHQISGTHVAHWGLGRDRKIERYSLISFLVDKFKLFLDRAADGYFAYTEGVKSYLIEKGLEPEKVFPVNNTIDINQHRNKFDKLVKKRNVIRAELGVSDKKVLLFVSTFKDSKKVTYLLKVFSILREKDQDFQLLLVGGGGESYLKGYDQENVTYFGSIVDLERLAPIYVTSDVFAYPGQVGLAPLQALCYDLPVITVNSSYLHGPEVEYLTPNNSLILNSTTTSEEYARTIIELFDNPEHLAELRANAWPSIKHLTIQQMALNFIDGINTILGF